MSSRNVTLALDERELGLKLLRLWVAAVNRLENGPRVPALCHEELRGIVGQLILFLVISSRQHQLLDRRTYLAVDYRGDSTSLDDALVQSQVEGIFTSRAEVQVLITASRFPDIQETVVNDRERRVLDPDAKALGDGVR